ncbi:hypothetical protein EMIT0P253_50219 [Pseudomonas sp. IT-P253]|jgi:hypothetical protein
MRVDWKDYAAPANGELSLLFENMQLTIESDCLTVDLGNGKACFHCLSYSRYIWHLYDVQILFLCELNTDQ